MSRRDHDSTVTDLAPLPEPLSNDALVVIHSKETRTQGTRFVLGAGPVRIGRLPDNEITFQDARFAATSSLGVAELTSDDTGPNDFLSRRRRRALSRQARGRKRRDANASGRWLPRYQWIGDVVVKSSLLIGDGATISAR